MAKKDFSDDSSSSRRLGGVSAILSTGRLGLYAENAFRALGMPVDASDIELQERHDSLRAYATLKRIDEVYIIAFGCNPYPTAKQLDDALERLNDGELRASDEFFWFWPREFGAENDPGLDAIAEGNAAEALQTWREWEQEGGLACAVARHNLAVNYLILALEETAKHLAGTLAKTKEEKLRNAWKNADKRWGAVAGDRHVWDETKKRILSKGDPALTAALVAEMKSDLRKTLSAIHGDIARHYAEKGLLEWAKFHVDAMLGDGNEIDDDYRGTVREVTKPVRDRLEAARAQAQSYAGSSEQGKKKQAFAKAREFFENDFEKKAKPALDLFYAGDDDLKKEREKIYDKVADTVCNCCVAAFNARQAAGESQDDDTALMKKILAIATDPKLRARIEQNIGGGGGGGGDPVLQEVLKTMVEVVKSAGSETPSARFRKLHRVRPKLLAWVLKNPKHGQIASTLKAFAMLERSLSVDIYNKDNDTALAITAIRCAIDDTPDAGDKAKFQGDLATLERRGGGGGVQAAGSGVLLEIMKMMAEVSKDTGSPSARFQKLERARPKLKTWAAKNPGNEQCKLLLKAFAMMERGLSVDIVNKEVPEAVKKRQFDRVKELVGLALLAINHAMEDTPDEDDRRKFRNDRKQLDKLAEGMGGVTIPTPDPDPDTPSTAPKGRTPWIKEQLIYALGFAVSLFLLSFAFRHHYPSGRPVAEFVVQWWHLPVAGFVAGLVLPLGRLPFPLPLVFAIYGFWSWAFTLVAWGVMAVYNAIVPEARELGLWWAPLIGFGIGVPIALLYAVVKKGSGGGKSKTRGSRGSGHPSPWYAGRPASALLFAVSLFLLSFVFRHYYPAGRPVAEILVQWWWFPAAGFVAGLLLPLGKMIHPLPQVGSAFAIWGSISTALVTAIIVAYNGIALETFVPELWRAAIIGFAISGMMIGPYWILTFVSQHAEAPTVPVREASLRRMPLVYLGVMFFLFSFSKDHIPLLAELPMLRWWHFPIAGVVLGFFVPVRTYRSSFFLQFYFMTTWPVTLLVWIGIIVYNAIAPETAAFAKCWAPYMGMALGYFILIFRLERIPVSLARMEKAMVK